MKTKINEKCNLGFGFDDTFKDDNHILSIALRANGIIGWIVRNFISIEGQVLEINKILIRSNIEYYTQV